MDVRKASVDVSDKLFQGELVDGRLKMLDSMNKPHVSVTRKHLIVAALFALTGLAIAPLPSEIVPEWHVQAVAENGKPIANVRITQEWSYSSLIGVNSQTLISNEDGQVIFPARRVWYPLLLKFSMRIVEYLNYLVMPHGSRVGPYSRVTSPDGNYYWLEHHPGRQQEHRLIIKAL